MTSSMNPFQGIKLGKKILIKNKQFYEVHFEILDILYSPVKGLQKLCYA